MPMVAAAAGAAVSWVTTAVASAGALMTSSLSAYAGLSVGTAAAITNAVGSLALSAALSAATTALMAPRTGGGGSPTSFKADPNAPISGVMGRFGVGGRQVHMRTWGKENLLITYFTVLSLGPIQGVQSFTANGLSVTFPGSQGLAANVEPYKDKMWMQYRDGLPSDTAFTLPSLSVGSPAMSPAWTSAHKFSGYAASMWTMQNNSKRASYENGVPRPLWTLHGMKLWDPRFDSTYPGGSGSQRRDNWTTWAYTENPYVHALAWVRGHHKNLTGGLIDRSKRLAGVGAPDDAIDIAALVEGANVADANGWKIAGEWTTADDKWNVLAAMLQAGGGMPSNRGAQISCMVNAPRASLMTLTGADLAGPVSLKVMSSRRDRFNTIIPRYRDESQKWEEVAAGPVTSSTYVTEDRGEPRTREVSYVYVRQAKQAAELGAYDLANARESLTGTLPSKPYLLNLRAGDAFTVAEPELGLNAQKFVVLRRGFDPGTAVVTLEVRSETDAKHAWALGQSASPPPSPSLTALDQKPDAPTSGEWTITPRAADTAGTQQPALVVSGEVASDNVGSVMFEYASSPGGPWKLSKSGPATLTGAEITGLNPGGTYYVRITYASVRGVPSDPTVFGPYTAPPLIGEGVYATGPNRITFSDFQKGTTGFIVLSYNTPTAPSLTRGETSGLPYLRLSGTATGEQLIVMGSDPAYRYPVKAGERIVARLGLHVTGAVYRTDIQIQWFNAAGALIGVDPVAQPYGVQAYNTEVFGFATAPARAVTAGLAYYINTTGAGAYAGSMIRPMVTGAFPNQTVPPPYVSGAAAVPGADPTGDNISAGFTGQGALATLSQVERQSIVGVDFINLVDGSPTTDRSWRPGYSSYFGFGSVPNANLDEGQPIITFARAETGLSSGQILGDLWHDFIAVPDVSYLVSAKLRGTAYAQGLARLELYFYDKDGVSLGGVTIGQKLYDAIVDTTTYSFGAVRKAPLGSVRGAIRLRMAANAAGVSAGQFRWRQPAVVKAARLGEGLVREDGTTILSDGTVVTTLGVAAGYIGQTAWGTLAEPVSKISKLKANGRATDSYQVANGVLSGATLYRNPVYVLGSVVNAGAARITIAAHSLTLSGSPVVSYGGGNINGLAFNTRYNVWVYDPDVVGGAVTYVATTSPTTYQTHPDYLLIDTIVTVKSDGGSGTVSPPPLPPGGDGTIDPSCVCVDSWLPSLTQARDVETADALLMLRDDGSGVEGGQVEGVRFAMAHCLRLRTVSGIELDCSTKTPIPYQKGKEIALKWAWECDGSERVAVLDHDGFRFEALAGPPAHIGWKRVAMISADNGVYAAGRQRGRFIFTHNIKWKG